MKLLKLTSHLGELARRSALLVTLVAATTITACGGGGGGDSNVGGLGTGPVISAADPLNQGVITGFGSIIVNGVRFDDSKATVSDDDNEDKDGGSYDKDSLRLGMVVSVSTSGTGTSTTTASVISFGSELQGPVQSIDGVTATTSSTSSTSSTTSTTPTTSTVTASSHTLVILGQTVIVGTRTIFDLDSLPRGFADIKVKDVLEVHGFLDAASNKLTATRVERKNNANKYKITGNIASLNSDSKTFKIGSESITYANIDPDKLRVTPRDGLTVKVRLATVQVTTGTWSATRVKPANNALNRNKVEIEGLITAFTNTRTFSVNGIPVDASRATMPASNGALAVGVRVEVKGSLVNGTLIATKVKVEGKDNDNDEDRGIELHGTITAVNASSSTFALRGLTVSYAGNVSYQRGTAADLKIGAKVEVKGVAAATGTIIDAQKIKFED
jgi:Domain of unknown function (DUF5666)